MNSHSEIRKRLAEYCGGELEPAERDLVAKHLASCPECRAELADMETVLRLLRTTPEVEPPPWLATKVMAQIREQQAGRKSWLQRLFRPLHIKLPLEALAVLFVCVTGYYLSRTVETEVKAPVTRPDSFEQAPAAPSSVSPPIVERQTDSTLREATPQAPERIRDKSPPPSPFSAPMQSAAPPPALQEAPGRPFAPPPAFREERAVPAMSGKGEALKAAPVTDSLNRTLDSTPEKRSKSVRRLDSRSEAVSPAAEDRTAEAPAGAIIPRAVLRLTPDDPATAGATVREAAVRSGGNIIESPELTARQIKVRIPAARLQELQNQLGRLGRITERPIPSPGVQLLEVTVQW